MFDLKYIREHEKEIRESVLKRGQDIKGLNDLLKKDKEFLTLKQEVEDLRHERNIISERINEAKKKGQDVSSIILKAKQIPKQLEEIEPKLAHLEEEINNLIKKIPNVLDKKTPLGKDASQNKVISKWGKIPEFKFPVKNHVEIIENLNLGDFDASAEVAGKGFYYLRGDLALLNQALIQFAIDFMRKKGYQYIETPLMVNKRVAAAAGDLDAFKLALYKIEGEELYMIPTAEHPILGSMLDKTIPEDKLPLKFYGYSMCFRKEIGAHGINEKGLWRTHQFNKVEQIIFCKPEDSPKHYEELLRNTEEIVKKLKLPYRIFESCAGDLGIWKTRGADLEIYRPTTKDYGELMSVSNCGAFQAIDLNAKGINKKGEKYYLHTLNNTVIATSRMMVAILENYQQKDGSIKVPLVLQKYLGKKVIGEVKKKISKKKKL
jgi:seryl-tRNA synthetase